MRIETAPVFEPLLEPARDKAAYGGRGSGKSQFFGDLTVEDALRFPGDAGEGLRMICGREIQKSLKESSKRLIEKKLADYSLGEADGFKVFNDRVETPKDGVIVFQGLQDHTSETIKSFEQFHRFWGEEAQGIGKRSMTLIRPTLRWENTRLGMVSELWWSWNPRRKLDAVDEMFRGASLPTGAMVVKANWSDNPWFPGVLNRERQDCLRDRPEEYEHIWEGGYATVLSGAYYAKALIEAKQQGRIGRVAADPYLPIKIFCDLGGTGARSDAFTMWAAQFVGKSIVVLDYYEAVGQPIGTHLDWLRTKGFTKERAQIYLPHDGETNDRVYDVSFESAFGAAGYKTTVISNQGRGAARLRIEATRRLFPIIWFNETTTEPGRQALGWYHEHKDEERNIGLGPEHDWASHGADAFGLMCVAYEAPTARPRELPKSKRHIV
ncbi:MAG: phage terminase large subunit [Rhizobium sp.]|nr:phage terminase large subunit [Rhizobium sp.]